MKHLDLFSGIGGFSLAASWVWGDDHEIVSFVEIDSFCQKVLKKHWPDVTIIPDIKDCNYEKVLAYATRTDAWSRKRIKKGQKFINRKSPQFLSDAGSGGGKPTTGNNNRRTCEKIVADTESKRKRSKFQGNGIELERTKTRGNIKQRCKKKDGSRPTIDLLTGGFPCQPYSVAGKQRGAKDDRAIWPQMLRVIREVRPTWIIGENVAGIINMELDQVLSDLESASYETQAFLIPACGVDAPHRRDRVWIVAYNSRIQQGWQEQRTERQRTWQGGESIDVSVTDAKRCNGRQNNEGQTSAKRNGTQETGDVADPFSIIKRKHGIGWPSGVSWWEREPAEIIQYARQERGEKTWMPEFKSELGRVAHGIPNRVDRLKSLGNAILPQCVVPIMQAIKEIEENETLSNRK